MAFPGVAELGVDRRSVIDVLLRRMVLTFGNEEHASGRSLAYVWGFGSVCLTAAILLPHPTHANVGGMVGVDMLGYTFAALMFVFAAALPRGLLEAITYLGQLLITALVFFWGAPGAPFLLFHLWLVVHSFHFLPPRRAALQIVCAAVLFVFATLATHAPFPAAVGVTGVFSIATIGLMVGAFRVRVDDLLQEAARCASTDPLTGLANRRGLADAYSEEQSRRARTGGSDALLVLDCDRFKGLNDRRGHLVGDQALCRVAEAMTLDIREVDTPARLGGDEFAVLFSAPEPGAAMAIGERIRRGVATSHDLDGMTVSVGIVELIPDVSVDMSMALAAADRAMYDAKSQGGNRVSVGTLLDPGLPSTTPTLILPPTENGPGVKTESSTSTARSGASVGLAHGAGIHLPQTPRGRHDTGASTD